MHARAVASPGDIDRAVLGRLVFRDAAARRRLNAATHLPIALALAQQLLSACLRHCPAVVLDMPLLFESGAHRLVSMTAVVTCSPHVQVREAGHTGRGVLSVRMNVRLWWPRAGMGGCHWQPPALTRPRAGACCSCSG
jgi:hypothetical protein